MPKPIQSSPPAQSHWLRIAGVAAIVLAIAGVLLFKGQSQPAASSEIGTPVAAVGNRVTQSAPMLTTPSGLPEEQLNRLLEGGQPTLAFFHSDSCYQCVQMTGIVGQVYPEYADSVALVDVNVYDERNGSLLRRAGIRVIPTMIFFDRQGRGQMVTGVMQPDQLQQQLAALVESR